VKANNALRTGGAESAILSIALLLIGIFASVAIKLHKSADISHEGFRLP